MDSTNVQVVINITVQMTSKLVLVNLNLKTSLSKIREKLEKNSEVKMNDTISFAMMINNNSTGGSLLAIIAREDEETMILENIINIKNNDKFLYLKSEPESERFFKDKLKLEYGRSVTLEKANSRAFTIMNCKMSEIIDGYENSTIQINSEENNIIKNDDFLLIADIDIPNFAKLGVSFENSNIKNSNNQLKEFIEIVKDVIDFKDPKKFKDIISDFASENSEENTGEHAINIGGQTSNFKIEAKSSKSLNKNNSSKYKSFKLFGGKQFGSSNFNESDWVESLNDFKYWSCIKFKDPVNVFQTLSEDLRKQVLLLVGKKILYTNTEDYTYHLSVPGIHHTFKLNIPKNILEILQHKDAECSIFATVIGKKEKDIFNCQVFWPSNEDPRLIIHCIQKKFRKHKCKLIIRWMIIGYDINFDFRSDYNVKLKILKNDFSSSNNQVIIKPFDLEYESSALYFGIPILNNLDDSNNSLIIGHHFFNDNKNKRIGSYIFSYCLKKNHFVNLCDFTFHILVISNHYNSDNYGIPTFQHTSKIRKLFSFIKFNSLKLTPNFICIYSTGENKCCPIFLKQKTGKIKIKYININCNQNNCICKSIRFQGLKDNLKYAFLDPKDYSNYGY
ncbi:hypothetical protein RhiirA4_471577 [Rhizophagus irregularis]|uniref:DUF7431 domain-containing protein n=1 Tax=Rhizophagus irregularis TaxID=588596 RepID=A0A2I1H3F6_9GLOM|nr:hypothetical protein RhiirA4_471577 [Rhizophagus irregularis]